MEAPLNGEYFSLEELSIAARAWVRLTNGDSDGDGRVSEQEM